MNHFRPLWKAEKAWCTACGTEVTAYFETVEWHQVERQPRRRQRRPLAPLRRRRKWQHFEFDSMPSDTSCGHDWLELEPVR